VLWVVSSELSSFTPSRPSCLSHPSMASNAHQMSRICHPNPLRGRNASFQALKSRNSVSTTFRLSAPSVLPTTAVPPTQPTPQRRITPERLSMWFQRSIQVPNRRDPLQTRLWNGNGNEGDVEAPSPSLTRFQPLVTARWMQGLPGSLYLSNGSTRRTTTPMVTATPR